MGQGSQSVLTVSAAGKVQAVIVCAPSSACCASTVKPCAGRMGSEAYEVMPNMAPNCELAISSARHSRDVTDVLRLAAGPPGFARISCCDATVTAAI